MNDLGWVAPVDKLCKWCGKKLVGGRKDRVFCDSTCAKDHQKKAWREQNPKSALGELSTGTVAEANEMRVAIDLLTLGYSVFRAAFQGMPCDMMICEPGSGYMQRVEVTSGSYSSSGTLQHQKRDETQYDVLAVVVGDKIFYKPELT